VRSVEYFKEVAPFVVTPKGYRTMLEADALALRKAALGRSVSIELRLLLRDEAARRDRCVARNQPSISARKQAVYLAGQLLTQFADKAAPGRSDTGPWVKLSGILFDVPGANMFEAVRRSPRAPRP
jgi:hypothetical protein